MIRFYAHFCLALIPLLVLTSPEARPQAISYIIPDIGTPGMNTYVEVIGPRDLPGNFGADGFWYNNPGDNLRLECVNAADTGKIVIGPLIVSWNGRMISAQIFVHPDLLPNSDNWQGLSPEFIIPLHVRYNGVTQNAATFYIVQPQPAITSSANGNLGSGGVWGLRSRSGAMIVDSLELLGGSYGISKADCDPAMPGNQGFLPAIILSKGPVRTGTGTLIAVDADTKHGGPGGGGGGGNFCDFTGNGADGGDGFTGGGPGGRNRSGNPAGSDEFRKPGTGTGADIGNTGGSLNGVPGGSAPAYEASGGGTGHPFGFSGEGCADGAGCNPPGGYGGGSGQQQTQAGGGGGYATAGVSSRNGNGGQAHGNDFIVPFAGGSGGASGNPQMAFSCSGDGGGGGGALRLYASQLDGHLFTALGGGGANGASGDGGSGSGGAVLLESRLPSGIWKIRAEGGIGTGPRGGAGRIRMDGPMGWSSSSLPVEESLVFGPSTDTTTFVRRMFTLTGTGDGSDIRLLLKSDRMPWTDIGTLSGYSDNWTIDIDLPAIDNVYYLAALQHVDSPSSDQYLAKPAWVMSQAAANILISRTAPEIVAEGSRQLRGMVCDDVRFDTMMVANAGDGVLLISDVDFMNGTRGFELVEPTLFPLSIDPMQSVRFITRFTRQPGQSGLVSDSLFIASNSPGASPLLIPHIIQVDIADFSVSMTDVVFPTVVICETAVASASVELRNTGTVPLRMLLPSIAPPAFELISPAPAAWPLTLQPGANIQVRLRVLHSVPGSLGGTLRFATDTDGCGRTADVGLSALSENVEIFVSDVPDFTPLRCAQESADETIVIRNDGDLDVIVEDLISFNSAFTVISPAVPFPLVRGAERNVLLRFAPAFPGTYTGALRVGIDRCSLMIDRAMHGQRDSIGLQVTSVDFGLQRVEDLPVMVRTTVTNSGNVPITITSATNVAPFRIASGLPVNLVPASSVDLMVMFEDPGVDGEHNQTLLLQHIPSCDEIGIPVHGIRGTAIVDLVVDTLSAEPGQVVDIPVYLRNAQSISLFGATGIRAKLRYRSSLLVPTGAGIGTIIGDERVLDLNIPLVTDANDVALRIPMMVTLGDAEQTVLQLTDVESVGGELTVNVVDGRFTLLGICRDGGTRLFDGGTQVQLKQNRPNPFNPSTHIEFVLIERGRTVLQIFDAMGRLSATLLDELLEPGVHFREFDARGLPSGVYIAVLRTPTVIKHRRMLLTK